MSGPTCQLYLITPPTIADLAAFGAQLKSALDAGRVDAVQIRLKPSDDDAILRACDHLIPIIAEYRAPVILNDRPDLAKRAGCNGVHLGQGDGTVASARAILGKSGMIGVTCHASKHLAIQAAEDGADYVAFGAFFPTTTKDAPHRPEPEILTWWSDIMTVPCVAIGGITPENAAPLVAAGAEFLAVSSGVWAHPDGPAAAVTAFAKILSKETA